MRDKSKMGLGEAHHDAGHEEAAWCAEPAIHDHEQQVGGAQNDQGLQGEVTVVALAHLKLQPARQRFNVVPSFVLDSCKCKLPLLGAHAGSSMHVFQSCSRQPQCLAGFEHMEGLPCMFTKQCTWQL